MSNLLAILRSSADAMEVFQKQLLVTQNNVSNASTPGYARQRVLPVAKEFSPDAGLSGGVAAGPMESARSRFAEANVRRQVQRQGMADARLDSLAGVEQAFPVDAGNGIAGALNGLLSSFSNWSVAPNDGNARQAVLDGARALAASFQDAASALNGAAGTSDRQLQETVDRINGLATELRDCNLQARLGSRGDAGLDARMNAALEELSGLVDITVVPQSDGSLTLLAGGMIPLVVGNNLHPLQLDFSPPAGAAFPDGQSPARILDDAGNDATARLTGGALAGTLEVRNGVIGGLVGNSGTEGNLNRLAQALAGRINQLVTAGQAASGIDPPVDLFTWNGANPTAAAASLSVNAGFTTAMLGAADAGPPYASNGTALKLASLGQAADAADKLDGAGFVQFYAGLAAGIGRQVDRARQESAMQDQLVAQSRSLRSQMQGVSLDEEAINLIQFQRAYQAAAQVLTVLNELTEATVNLLR